MAEDWKKQARCREITRGPETDFWFTDADESPELRERKIQLAKVFCNICVVQQECLEYAISGNEKYGVWGGKTHNERLAYSRT